MNTLGKIIVTSATIESRMCPMILSGKTADGSTVYARFRWGKLSVRLDSRDPAENFGAGGKTIMEKQLDPTGLNGCLSYDEIREITAEIVEWPEAEPMQKPDDQNETWIDGI